jgi:hypothetical protein
VLVNQRLLRAIELIAGHVRRRADRDALLGQARAIADTCLGEIPEWDRSALEAALESAVTALRRSRSPEGEDKGAAQPGSLTRCDSRQVER